MQKGHKMIGSENKFLITKNEDNLNNTFQENSQKSFSINPTVSRKAHKAIFQSKIIAESSQKTINRETNFPRRAINLSETCGQLELFIILYVRMFQDD